MVTEKMLEAYKAAHKDVISAAIRDYSKRETVADDARRAGIEAALSAAEPAWWIVTTDMGKVIFHGSDKDRADRVASIHGREAQALYASPRAGATQVKDIAIPGVKLGMPMLQALSRLAGSRHSDGTSSIVSAEDRSVIIDTCHAIMTGAAALSAQVQDVAREEFGAPGPDAMRVIDPDQWEPCSPSYLKRGGCCATAPRVWHTTELNHWHPKLPAAPAAKLEGKL